MASPVGHAMMGIATAAVATRVMDADATATLWLGAVLASGLPDLDVGLSLVGKSGPRYHRNASHSIFVLGACAAVLWWICGWWFGVATSTLVAWTAALFSHPFVDVIASGPAAARRGYGIALLWPVSRLRVTLPRPLFETADLGRCRTVRDVWIAIRPELLRLGPIAVAITATAMLV